MNFTQTTLFRTAVVAAMALAVIGAGLALLPRASAANFVPPPASAQQNDQPQIGPGLPLVGSNATKSAASNTKAGSALFFHKYASDNANPSGINTLISLTNANPRDAVTVRLFFVRDCTVINQFVNLAANQTRTFLASSEDPGKIGYMVAVAVNAQGAPTQFNWLIGAASLRDAQGHEGSYNAVGVAKRTAGPVASVAGGVAEMKFNDVEYDRLPQSIALDNIQSQDASGARTDVTLYSPLSNLSAPSGQTTRITATSYEQNGTPHPAVVDTPCVLSAQAGAIWTNPPINSYITANNPGWGSFAAATVDSVPLPLFGLSLTDGASARQNNVRHMQVLSRLDTFSMTVPVSNPPNPAGDPFTANQPDAPGGSLGAGELKAGSALIFHRFTSGIYGQSRINITNTHPTLRIRARVFFIGLADQTLTDDMFINLLPNQTTTLDPAQFAPNQKGWVFAMAVDGRALPTNFNFLIGSGQAREQGGGASGYTALAIAKNSPGSVPRNSDVMTADILFNGAQYDRLPSTLGLAGLPSQGDNTTTVGYERPPLSLLDPPSTRGSATATAYDDAPASFTATIGPIEARIGTVRPSVLAAPITSTIANGRRGWLKLSLTTPIFGWSSNTPNTAFSAQPGNPIWTGGFNGGSMFFSLAAADSYLLKAPGINPDNLPPTADFAPIDFVAEARALTGTIVRLDGRPSSDPNAGDPLTFRWTDNDRLITTASVSDFRLGIGTHIIKLVVTDGNGVDSEPRNTQVDVRDTQRPIMSGVPTNISKTTGNSVGAAINFPSPLCYDYVDSFLNVTASKASGSLFPIGRTVVTFTCRDFQGNQTTATTEVNVTKGAADFPATGGVARNKTPFMNNINDQIVPVGTTRAYLLEFGDPDNGDMVDPTLLGAPSFARIDNADPVNRRATLLITPQPGDTVVTNNVRVVLNDRKTGGIFMTLPFRIIIGEPPNNELGNGQGPTPPDPNPNPNPNPNRPPVAVAAPIPSPVQATSRQGAMVHLDGSQSNDPDNDTLTYSWKDNGVEIATTAVVDVFLAVGQHSITLTVSDGRGGSNTTAAQAVEVLPRPLTVTGVSPAKIRVFNQTILTISGTGFTPGTQVRFDCTSFCQGGSRITVTITRIEEDMITVNAKTTQDTPLGNRDVVVTSPDGKTVKLSRSNFVAP
ncbi:MAG TPA: PKD domain-containing protein [Blastocatellia bacterium]|nr:PKD domain-containing protein [Blastocatellia bacterium]